MVLEFFKYAQVDSFLAEYDFTGIEPFTLVMVDGSKVDTVLTELVWDGEEAHIRELDPHTPRIWSSATLYPKEIAGQRAGWFEQWQAKHHEDYGQQEIIDFHKRGGQGDLWNDFVMKRGDNLQTVSITSIEKNGDYHMTYEDLINDSKSEG